MIMAPIRILSAFATAAALFLPAVLAQNLTAAGVNFVPTIEDRLSDSAHTSWELGTRSQALLELNADMYSVLTPGQPLPPVPVIPGNVSDYMNTIIGIAHQVVANRSVSNHNLTGPQPIVNDTSAADPCSLGMIVLLAHWVGQQNSDGLDYAGAAQDQLDFLLGNVTRATDGTISTRTDQFQVWSDAVYMIPPFLAYYGVITRNQSMLQEAYTQISLYRSHLLDSSANNLWKHIQLGEVGNDDGHWATGNAWAAAGILRVIGTIQNSEYSSQLANETSDLISWAQEIQGGMYSYLDSNYIFKNYPDQELSNSNFYDAASTALMASTVYRLQTLANITTYIDLAEKSRTAISELASGSEANLFLLLFPDSTSTSSSSSSKKASTPTTSTKTVTHSSTKTTIQQGETSTVTATAVATVIVTSSKDGKAVTSTQVLTASGSAITALSSVPVVINGSTVGVPPASTLNVTQTVTSQLPSITTDASGALQHFSADGWLTPVVNPYNYSMQGTDSPEAEAFVIMMQAAWRDWKTMGSGGSNTTDSSSSKKSGAIGMRSLSAGWAAGVLVVAGVVLQWA